MVYVRAAGRRQISRKGGGGLYTAASWRPAGIIRSKFHQQLTASGTDHGRGGAWALGSNSILVRQVEFQ
jgi:hypothetical protein